MCYYGLPSDCRKKISTWDIYVDTTHILQKGMVLILVSNLSVNMRLTHKLSIIIFMGLFFVFSFFVRGNNREEDKQTEKVVKLLNTPSYNLTSSSNDFPPAYDSTFETPLWQYQVRDHP